MVSRFKPIPQAQLDPDLQRRKATWRDTEIESVVMWDDISDDMLHKALSIAPHSSHPLWDGIGTPTKDAVAYMQALQGKHGKLFGSLLNRSTNNYTELLKSKKPDQRIDNCPYASLFEWWRTFLIGQGVAMILPFPLATIGEPFFTPKDVRYVQRVGQLYVYGSSKNKNLMLPSYRRS